MKIQIIMLDIITILSGKWEDGTRPEDLAVTVLQDVDMYMPILFEGLNHKKKKVQSGCAVILSTISEVKPNKMIKDIDLFIKNIDAKEPVKKWHAICTLGNIVQEDKEDKIAKNVERIYNHLQNKSVVLRIHCLRALIKIAVYRDDLRSDIVDNILANRTYFVRNEIGFIFEEMAKLAKFDNYNRSNVLDLIKNYENSEVSILSKKAKKSLKEFGKYN